ncbi:M14 metallopeptidase family protein [Thalassobellus suaedae]|uniref:M14 family metallopeptidase n=1 Tax=Thalassobellus suaedae TaxID=3074124 RepID=A0ABY9Y1Z1_9FLAO|nr:M14 family metallopeptidase [Flavobacteriaceae bacterium HL-DH10]
MKVEDIKSLFLDYKETSLYGRYITNNHISSLLKEIGVKASVEVIGKSVLNDSIYGLKIGNGNKRILMWSQMHGNESTTTKAIFDLLNTLLNEKSDVEYILEACTLYIIPILNPDGAKAYTRINANKVDLNRDAQDLSQPESKVLRDAFKRFKPHFCYNLHGQRTIFSAGTSNKPATVSFLAPAQDKECAITPNRKIAMEVIGVMNTALQKVIPKQVGVYDDAFNLNCVGDTFQSENVPTILFEAGHYYNDYNREQTREYIYVSLLESLDYISKNVIEGNNYECYLQIPENDKCFYDIIIRNAKNGTNGEIVDIGILYQEKLVNGVVNFIPKIEKIEKLSGFYGHKEFDANELGVFDEDDLLVKAGYENVFVILNNEKISLLVK